MIRPAAIGKPKLKLKAAEGRKFLSVLHYMLSHFFPVADAHSRMRLQCVAALLSLYSELDSWGASSPYNIGCYARRHLMLYAELSRQCTDEARWNLHPKHHLLLHVAESARVNPKLEWSYPDESAIGEAATVAGTANQRHVVVSLLARYRATLRLE